MEYKKKIVIKTTCGAHVLHDGLVDMLYALLPLLRDAFGLTYAEVGLIRSAHKTATSAFQIPVGIWSESTGARLPLVLGTALAGMSFVLLGSSTGFWATLVFVFLAGCGGAFQHPVASSLISKTFDGEGQKTALGVYNAFGDVGKFLFLGATIFLTATIGLSWQVPVVGVGIISLIVATVIYFALTAAGEGCMPQIEKKLSKQNNAGWGIRNKKGFVLLGIIAALDNITRNGFLTFVSFLMIDKGISSEWAAIAVLATVFGGMIGKAVVGKLADLIGVSKTIALTEFATALFIVLILFAPILIAFSMLPILGVFLNGTSSIIYGAVPEVTAAEKHSRAFGFIYTLGSICGIVGPLVYGFIADFFSLQTTMIIIAGMVLFTIPLCGPLSLSLNQSKPIKLK